jgi:carboxyl-terminal processing protease
VAGRSEFVEEALVRGFQFDIDENYQFDRTDASWAVDATELNDIWRKRIKNEYLVLKAAGQSNEQILKILGGRYR